MRDNWKKEPIINFADVVSGGTPSTAIQEFWDGNIVWITPADLSKIKTATIKTSSRKISKLGLQSSSANLIPKNSIVMSSRAPIGYFAVPTIDFSTNQGCKSMVLKQNQDANFHYYNFVFNVEKFKAKGEGTTFAEISKKEIEKIELDVPSLSQQRKIAQILATCDAVIEKTEAAIAKYQAMKQGLMHDLFTRGIDINTGKLRPKQEEAPHLYKESELGWIPKEWEVKKLEEIANYVDYRGKTPPKSDKGIFLITAKNIKQGYIDYDISQEYIPEFAYKAAMSRGIPEIGDVLITTEAPMGNIAQINIEGLALAQRVIKYRCIPSEMLNDFLKHSMMSEYFQKELEAESTGSTVKGIKGSRLHQLNLFKPEILEQKKITQSLAPLELKIQTEQLALSKYQLLKTGLMQDLLSGKVEVKV